MEKAVVRVQFVSFEQTRTPMPRTFDPCERLRSLAEKENSNPIPRRPTTTKRGTTRMKSRKTQRSERLCTGRLFIHIHISFRPVAPFPPSRAGTKG
ncbi:hypothetical protein ZHAS_00013943 [Anopheles sinensis]|uniref:Uncharacterized protein n=1 Tax=Anopheles sinensis TaxID=74873 RepID=A0A084W6Y4_ANOSI|nr:hypothetical protein ZHAS_00013943 [Anopheles sinensis]